MLSNINTEANAGKRLAFSRLYAEFLASLGKTQVALEYLQQVLRTIDLRSPHPTVVAQARSTEVGLLTRLGEYKKAEYLCELLLSDSNRYHDKLSAAIAYTRRGEIYRLSGSHKSSYDDLLNSVDMFLDLEDRRGLAWALLQLAVTQLVQSNSSEGAENLNEAMRIAREIGECSRTYLELLEEARGKITGNTDNTIVQDINIELERVHAVLDE